jgi:hypothetical protein
MRWGLFSGGCVDLVSLPSASAAFLQLLASFLQQIFSHPQLLFEAALLAMLLRMLLPVNALACCFIAASVFFTIKLLYTTHQLYTQVNNQVGITHGTVRK